MLSIPILWEEMRENRKRWLMYTGILCLLAFLCAAVYLPGGGTRLDSLFSNLPENVLKILHMESRDHTLVGRFGAYIYGFWFVLIPLIYTVRLAYELVAARMETGSMIYYVCTPLGRKNIIFTQGYFLTISQLFMLAAASVFGIIFSQMFSPGSLELPQFLLLNITAFCLQFFWGGLELFLSCTGLERRILTGLIWGLPVLSFGLYLLGNLDGALAPLRYVSVFSILDPEWIFTGDPIIFLCLLLLLAGGGGFYGLAIFVFRRRDLEFGKKVR